MEYRALPHGGDKISVIGLGAGSLHESDPVEIERTVEAAIEAGINHFDYVTTNDKPFEPMACAFRRHRDEVHLQVHLGADYRGHAYAWTTDPDVAISEFEQRLRTLGTDYADFGFTHCIDEDADIDRVMNGGIWDYALRQKQAGVIRHLGFSTHSVRIARRLIATGEMDLGMFSLNPVYDYTDESEYGKGEASDRAALYREFERAGVGISVMKPFAGGRLLDAATSPFGRALTRVQCIRYALDRPGVLTVLPGVRGMADLDQILAYVDATPAERDYAVLADLAPESRAATCVYCNHCQPCPRGIQIGTVNKYYDLARLGDEMAAEHYHNLGAHAGAISVGIIEGSSEMALSEAEYAALDEVRCEEVCARVASVFRAAGADAVIRTMAELPALARQVA